MDDYPRRGEIWMVSLDPAIGAEIKKTRPGLIVSNNTANLHSGTATVLPITDRGEKIYPFETALSAQTPGLTKDSKVRCQQIRTIDQKRCVRRLGAIEEALWEDIEKSLRIHLDMSR